MLVKSPETIYISFQGLLPKYFELYDNLEGKVYYFRFLDGKTPRIKFNVTHPCDLVGNVEFKIEKRESIRTPYNLPSLPEPDRNRAKPIEIVVNESLQGTPCCVYTDEGIIEVSEWFLTLPKQIQNFLYYHEHGHLFYSDEHSCDVYALVCSLRKGYNRSMCFYALSEILSRSKENVDRVTKIFNKIQETQNTPLWQ